jgi:hypothetical protein
MIPTHLLKYLQFYLKNLVLKALVPKALVPKALVLKALLLILQRLKRDEVSLQIARAGGWDYSK